MFSWLLFSALIAPPQYSRTIAQSAPRSIVQSHHQETDLKIFSDSSELFSNGSQPIDRLDFLPASFPLQVAVEPNSETSTEQSDSGINPNSASSHTASSVSESSDTQNSPAPSESQPSTSENPAPNDSVTSDQTNSPAAPAVGQTQDLEKNALFEQVFGTSRSQSQSINVPFYINDQKQGETLVLLASGGPREFQAFAVLKVTAEILRAEIQSQLEAAVDSSGNLSIDTLRQTGISVVFDQHKLELYFQIPAELRQTTASDLSSSGLPAAASHALRPSHVSGYINLRGSESFVWAGNDSIQLGRQPLQIALDGAINIENWVLEGSATFAEQSQPVLTRGDFRVVRDDPAHALRYVMGELSPPINGFYQTSSPILGVSVERNYSLQPYRSTRPVGQYSFFLERPSKVEVYVNGSRVQTLQLPAGSQDIRNLPLSTGVNAIQLVITDDLGQVQRLDFSPTVAGSLLAKGLEQFSYSFGFPLESLDGSRVYHWDQPTLSLSYRRGMTNNFVLGGYLQANLNQQVAGVQAALATKIGDWGWDAAVSHSSELGTDVAARLQYDYRAPGENPANRSFHVAAEYRGANFATFGSYEPSDYILDLSAYYSQTILDGINFNVGANYQFGRDRPNTYNITMGLSQSFDNGMSTSFNVSHSQNQDGQTEDRAFVSLYWLFPKQRQSVSLSSEVSNTDEASSHLSWSISPERNLQSVSGSVDLGLNPDSYDLSARLSHTNYRFTLDVTQNFSFPRSDDSVFSSSTQLNFGTALVFADGHFAWSRPITNSFAIITPRANLRSFKLGINPDDDGFYQAMADQFGPAVIPDLQPYYLSTLQVAVPNLPVGYDAGPSQYTLLPSYRSGTLIEVGTEATVFLRGTLMDSSGNPIPLQAGEVVSLSDSDWPSVTLFTNRAGRFALSGFKPGRYELRRGSQSIYQFEIPEGQSGMYDLGEVKVNWQ